MNNLVKKFYELKIELDEMKDIITTEVNKKPTLIEEIKVAGKELRKEIIDTVNNSYHEDSESESCASINQVDQGSKPELESESEEEEHYIDSDEENEMAFDQAYINSTLPQEQKEQIYNLTDVSTEDAIDILENPENHTDDVKRLVERAIGAEDDDDLEDLTSDNIFEEIDQAEFPHEITSLIYSYTEGPELNADEEYERNAEHSSLEDMIIDQLVFFKSHYDLIPKKIKKKLEIHSESDLYDIYYDCNKDDTYIDFSDLDTAELTKIYNQLEDIIEEVEDAEEEASKIIRKCIELITVAQNIFQQKNGCEECGGYGCDCFEPETIFESKCQPDLDYTLYNEAKTEFDKIMVLAEDLTSCAIIDKDNIQLVMKNMNHIKVSYGRLKDHIKSYTSDIDSNFQHHLNDVKRYREIVTEQHSTDLIIKKRKFDQLCKEIAQDFKSDLYFEPEALEILQHISEDYMIKTFEKANINAVHAKKNKNIS